MVVKQVLSGEFQVAARSILIPSRSRMTGMFGFVGEAPAGLLEHMAARLGHRGRSLGLWRGAGGEAGFAFGQRWSEAERPFAQGIGQSRDGSVRCVIGGSLFEVDELARSLGLPEGLDDATVVAELIARTGTEGLARLDGAFSLAACDREGVILARDALGERPLYYAHLPGVELTLFASEIKAMLATPELPGVHVRPDLGSLGALLVFSFIPGPRTMFEGVCELEPGCFVRLRPGQPPSPSRSFWTPRENVDPSYTDAGGAEQIEQLCRAAIARRLPRHSSSDRRIAASLSGGVDSSAVVAMLAEAGHAPVCWSVAFGHGQPNELGYAKMVTDHCRLEHRVIDVEPDQFLDLLPEILWRLDDPLCDCITVPNYILARHASAESSVVFNGEGGDPLFGGPKNKFMILGEWYKPYGGYDRHHAYLASYHKFHAHLEQACTPELLAATGGAETLCEFVAPYLDDPSIDSFLNRLMKINIRLKGGQNILVKVDKMLSCNAVRSASPLFDRRLAEFSMQIPPSAKRRGDVEKYAFKLAVEPKLPYAVVYRKKAGMGVPLNHWFRKTALRDYASDLLRSERARARGYFQPEFVDALLDGKGPPERFGRDRSGELAWMLLAIELWHRVYVDGEHPHTTRGGEA